MKFVPQKVPVNSATRKKINPNGTVSTIFSEKEDVKSPGEFIWKIWKQATKKDSRIDDPKGIVERINATIGDWKNSPFDKLELLTRRASYLPPVEYVDSDDEDNMFKIDEHDTERLLSVFTNSRERDRASDISRNHMAKPIPYAERESYRQRLESLCKVFAVGNFEELDYLDRNALSVLASLPPSVFNRYVDIIESADKKEELNLSPEEFSESKNRKPKEVFDIIKRNGHIYISHSGFAGTDIKIKDTKKKTPLKGSAYEKGRKEDRIVATDDMEVDITASGMIDEGYPVNVALEYHNQAPRGYWRKVIREIYENPKKGLRQVYDDLEEKFDFHPDDRVMPDLL